MAKSDVRVSTRHETSPPNSAGTITPSMDQRLDKIRVGVCGRSYHRLRLVWLVDDVVGRVDPITNLPKLTPSEDVPST